MLRRISSTRTKPVQLYFSQPHARSEKYRSDFWVCEWNECANKIWTPIAAGRGIFMQDTFVLHEKKTHSFECVLCWHWPIFPSHFQLSIVGTGELNFRVRNGNGWTLTVNNTNYSFSCTFKTEQSMNVRVQGLFACTNSCLGQALELLVPVSWMCYHTYTSGLSTM